MEHNDLNVGVVTESWIEGERVMVRCRLDDTPRGWGLSKLVKIGDVAELSLKHALYSDGKLVPIEVSVVGKGARPETVIVPETVEYITAKYGGPRR